ncbi:two-component system, NarL family, sensor histidine kinase UhpB [biofilm metagenome]
MSLSYLINLRILLFSLLILVLGGGIAIWQARSAVDKEINASVKLTAHLISCGMAQESQDHAAWLDCFNSLVETRHLTIDLVKPSGEVLGRDAKNKSNDHENLPPQWFINLIGGQRSQTERQITTSYGEQYSLKIQANPLDEIKEAWNESLAFFGVIVVLTQLIFLSVYWALRNTFSSIRTIVSALKQVETGDYRHCLPEFKTKEINSIAGAINHMTDELQQAQQDNRTLVQHSLAIQENERKQLAQELHDELGQSLTAIKMMAASTNRKGVNVTEITDSIADICDDLINVVRSIMKQLHPLTLTELGLKAAIEDLLSHWTAKTPDLNFHFHCPVEVNEINQNITIQIFRVIQECLTNVLRHAEATECFIDLNINGGQGKQISLSVTDNGTGCPVSQLNNGFGVLGMKERIHSLGGSLSIYSSLNYGVEVKVLIPLVN